MSYLADFERIVPSSKGKAVDWNEIERSPVGMYFLLMKNTEQDPIYHGEENVYTQTLMVCEELIRISGSGKIFRSIPWFHWM